jgi:hypothetical protein
VSARSAVLPAIAAALVAGVLGVQVANGGGEFAPTRSADPCAPRAVAAVSAGLDGLAEQLVLLGLDGAACRLATSREALVLRLGVEAGRTDAEVEAVRGGLLDAVDRLDREGRLPKVSALADEALDQADLPGFVEDLVRRLPDSFIDGRLATDDLLRTTVAELDVRALLGQLGDLSQAQATIRDAVVKAALQTFMDGLPRPFG